MHLIQMLDRKNKSLKDIISTLQMYHDAVNVAGESSMENDSDQAPSQKEILRELMAYLKSC
jgi:beta-catenin-like protein 1